MIVNGVGHWNGDPRKHCAELHVAADNLAEADKLALLLRVLSDPEQRAALIHEAARIEATAEAALDPVLA